MHSALPKLVSKPTINRIGLKYDDTKIPTKHGRKTVQAWSLEGLDLHEGRVDVMRSELSRKGVDVRLIKWWETHR